MNKQKEIEEGFIERHKLRIEALKKLNIELTKKLHNIKKTFKLKEQKRNMIEEALRNKNG